MVKFKEQLKIDYEHNQQGDTKLYLSDLADFDKKNPKLRTFALAQLKAGEEVEQEHSLNLYGIWNRKWIK